MGEGMELAAIESVSRCIAIGNQLIVASDLGDLLALTSNKLLSERTHPGLQLQREPRQIYLMSPRDMVAVALI